VYFSDGINNYKLVKIICNTAAQLHIFENGVKILTWRSDF